MSSSRAHSFVLWSAGTVGLFYALFCMYYAARRLESNDWNQRESRLSAQLWVKDLALQKLHDRMEQSADTMPSEVTIITAYYNIGSLRKGGPFGLYTPEKYVRWMTVFGRIDNPVIFFTDSQDLKRLFEIQRSRFSPERTQVHLVDRQSLWAFRLAPEIKAVFTQPGYPKFVPNTVHENYSCVMHAKFELVHKVITESLFRTQFLAWMDIGIFRDLVDEEQYTFPLVVPEDFDPRKVAYSGQRAFQATLTPMQVVSGNKVWVGGAMFLARPEVMYVYTQDYMKAVRKLLDMKIMSTDQQVIYIMYLPSFDFQPRVEIQTYTTHGHDDWFYLAYMLKDAWDINLRRAEPLLRFLLSFMT